jgi:hypothetical protein
VDAAVHMAGGATAPALTDYTTAIGGPEPAGAIYSEAAAVYLQTGKKDKAVEVIESGWTRLQEPPSLAVPLIRTYRLSGRQADADRVATQCAVRWPACRPSARRRRRASRDGERPQRDVSRTRVVAFPIRRSAGLQTAAARRAAQ